MAGTVAAEGSGIEEHESVPRAGLRIPRSDLHVAVGVGLFVLAIVVAAIAPAALAQLGIDTSPAALARVTVAGIVALAVIALAFYGLDGYLAALWVFAPLAPVIAAAVSGVAYLIAPDAAGSPGVPADHVGPIYLGLVVAALAWSLLAFPGASLASRERAQMRVYRDLLNRFLVLRERVNSECAKCGPTRPKALLEATAILDSVETSLCDPSCAGPSLQWVMISGYTSMTRQLHRVEEALITVEAPCEIVGDVIHDDLSLEDSGLKNPFALRRVIRDALPSISRAAADALLPPVPALPRVFAVPTTPTIPAVPPAPAAPAGLAAAAAGPAPADSSGASSGSGDIPARGLSPDDAREALREVRFAINDYRDDLMDSFARGRNRVVWAYLAVAFSTYALLGLGLIIGLPKQTLVSVGVLYMVGGLVGLFSRLRIESSRPPTVEDYGLYMARLVTGPLLSGLAAVAGVYLIAQAPGLFAVLNAAATAPASGAASGAGGSPAPVLVQVPAPRLLADIYDLTKNQLALLIAAVFGLAPGLLTSGLQQQVDRMERDVARSKPATSASVGGAPGGTAAADGG